MEVIIQWFWRMMVLYLFVDDNSNGQLGLGHKNNVNKFELLMKDSNIDFISCGFDHSFIKKTNGEIWVFGSNS